MWAGLSAYPLLKAPLEKPAISTSAVEPLAGGDWMDRGWIGRWRLLSPAWRLAVGVGALTALIALPVFIWGYMAGYIEYGKGLDWTGLDWTGSPT